MSGATDLERSVLERKERGELHVIAESLGLKPGTRTKKADLIDQILEVTGVGIPRAGINGDGEDHADNGSGQQLFPTEEWSAHTEPSDPTLGGDLGVPQRSGGCSGGPGRVGWRPRGRGADGVAGRGGHQPVHVRRIGWCW